VGRHNVGGQSQQLRWIRFRIRFFNHVGALITIVKNNAKTTYNVVETLWHHIVAGTITFIIVG
jgi:hypothetical protein